MKRLLIVLSVVVVGCALGGAVVLADTSANQMTLSQNPVFIAQVEYSLVQQAYVIKAEGASPAACSGVVALPSWPSGATCHSIRSQFATNVLTSPYAFAAQVAVHLVGQTNVLTATTTCNAGVCLSNVTDAALLSQIATNWNTMAGVL